jgi:hypothetical protein
MIELRPYAEGDVHYLINIDRKATDFPYDAEDWKIILAAELSVLVATDQKTPIGFSTVFLGSDNKVMWLGQLSVLPAYPMVATLLLEAAFKYVRSEGCLRIAVTCCELDLKQCQWYVNHGFTIEDTIDGAYELYGQSWQGYYFTKDLRDEDAAKRVEGREHDAGEASDQD